jgi:Na+/H+ antiporter NhaD/arsenite permease-like protein
VPGSLVGEEVRMPSQQILAAVVFVGVYLLIVSDRVHRTVAALVGAVAVIALGLLTQQEAFSDTYVDWNVIFLLVGMMAIANILAKTGLFEWLAAEAVVRTKGDAYRLLVLISLITAVVSAFIDNVTTVVLITPIIFVVAERLRVSPMPLLISEILASNIGGTATLIGDPPNIIIGSRLGKDFGDFIVNATPAIVVALVAYLIFARWLFRRELAAAPRVTKEDIEALATEERRIADPRLMRISLAVLAFTILGFILARPLGLGGATVALTGATLLMLLTKQDASDVLRTIDWASLVFFIALFIVVGAVVKTGLIGDLASATLSATGGRTDAAALVVLWASGVLSAIIDNIPYTITMVPLVADLGRAVNIEPLIWALSFGANLGGNATVIGASANVIVAGMSAARGQPITFRGYLRYGVPATLVTMTVCTIDIWLRYFVFG